MTNSISEVVDADVILVCGSNTTETHPVIGAQIRQAVNRGAKLIVADPREIPLAEEAEVFLPIRPGTNVALLNGMMNVIINEGLLDKEYVENRTEGFDELWEIVKEYTADKVGMICGIDPEDLKKAARLYATAERAPIFYAMGITQHTTGTAGVMSTANLALLCGKVGKYGCGVNPLRGQNNVQGACDMGCLPGDYTGYQKVANPEARAKFEAFWGVPLPSKPGLTITEILSGAETGDIRCLYIMGENPMVSDANLHHVEQALRRCELLIVQDIFLTETAELADVVLPAACYAEKKAPLPIPNGGCSEFVQRWMHQVRAVKTGSSSPRSSRLGMKIPSPPREILEEIAQITPSYGGFSYDRLEKEQPQWPCPSPEHPGTPILHTAKFSRGERAIFKPSPYMPAAEQPDEHYPFILTTGRILYQYHTRTMTGKSDDINRIAGRSFVEIHPTDAAKKGIAQGDQVKVASRRGEVIVEARVTERVSEGVIFMPFHFAEAPANRLTNNVVDPISKIPEYKVCSAQVQAL